MAEKKNSSAAGGKLPRVSRRVQANPSGINIDPAFGDEQVVAPGEDYADRTLSNDEQLKRDKPPHWG